MLMLHAKAHVDTSVKIGYGCKIWQFASIIRGASIGDDCTIASCAIVDGATVGDRCLIGHGAQLHPGTRIGNNVFVGPGAIFCNDLWPSTAKDGFDANALRGGNRWTVIVEDDAVIGAGAIILPGIRIFKGSMVAAGAVPDHDVQAGMVWRRNGYMAPIPTDANERRMCFVREGLALAADAA